MVDSQQPEPSETRPSPPAAMAIVVEHARCVNFALHQNGVRFVRRIALVNKSAHDLEEVVVRARLAGPLGEIARPWEGRVSRVAAGTTYNLLDVNVELAPELLARQTERESTDLVVEAISRGDTLASATSRIDVLAATEWAGGNEFSELLAAFVTPNHPAIDSLLSDAGKLLREWTGDAALSGYQSRSPARARVIVAAIYTAMSRRGIGYINPPASFEASGQKVRLADQVLDGKLGTCIDVALVLAAAIEQAGLHPLIILQSGHAFVGAWLIEETFADPIVDTSSRLANRVELDEMLLVEAVGVTSSMDFDAAAQRGRTLLSDKDKFRWALDVRAARRAAVRPLPIRVGGVGGVVIVPTDGEPESTAPASIGVADRPCPAAGVAEPAPRTRIDKWKRKLLDLSLRNRLINFRETAQSVVIECPDVVALEDGLAASSRYELLPKPEVLIRGADVSDAAPEATAAVVEARKRVLLEELGNKRLRTTLAPAEMATRLTTIYRAAKLSIEENGANTLFLALGSLLWYESKESQQPRAAPLLLLPVTLERPAPGAFRLVAADEEPRINVTLVEKLAQEFGIDAAGLREVPEDDNGVDVALVFRRFREQIASIDRWEVQPTAQLGLFTFSKFLMWLDLQEREEDLRRSKVVTYLVDRPNESFDPAPFPKAGEIDRTLNMGECPAPLDADSSQLVAVAAAQNRRSFVLEGPPGTGKSQTITNLIAAAIADGKRVLFVAEKMAALSVVKKRLERVGLAPFCLEVHSNKSSKKEVLEQIALAFESAGAREPQHWQQHVDQLKQTQTTLNAFVEELHKSRPIGRSFYQIAADLVGLFSAPDIELKFADPAAISAADCTRIRQLIEALALAGRAVGDIPSHPLREVGRATWQDSLPDQFRAQIDATSSALNSAQSALQSIARTISGTDGPSDIEAWSRPQVLWLIELARSLLQRANVAPALLTEPGWSELHKQLAALIDRGRKRDALRVSVLSRASDRVFKLDLDALIATLKAGSQKVWPLSWLACRGARKAAQQVWTAPGGLPDNATLIATLEDAARCRAETEWLASDQSEGTRFFARAYQRGEADWDALESTLNWVNLLRSLLLDAPNEVLKSGAIRLATAETPQTSLAQPLATCDAFLVQCRQLESLIEPLEELFHVEHLRSFRGGLARWKSALGELNDWCFWRRARQSIDPVCIPLAAATESGTITCDQLVPAFDKALSKAWVGAISDSTGLLRDFNVAAHEGDIAKFRDLDRKWLDLAAQIAQARAAQRVPPKPADGGAASSEMGILAHQMRLQRRHMPVRKLIGKLPNLLPRLKPCFLMSPLSVAQYLDPAYPPFDLVVFDEASQIPVWDAVGAIARGSSVIVVGDSKQLPPTNFFQKLDGEEAGDEDDFEELESILDECVASGLPSMRLLWHYRSRHESLIAFSNHHYYQGKLLTFPVPQDRSDALGVSLRVVPRGTYDRGASRTNRVEAEAVVAELHKRLASKAPESIGIVTFSSAQQSLIEDLIDARRREDAGFDAAMNLGEEPVFIKNLENVQGDERDVILFSVGYAPDANGRMVMSFGPLNRDGGERRLNVAVTRARRQVIVFSSIRADQIDLARTRAVGAAHLKSFLEYAERGPAAIGEAASDIAIEAGTPLEASVKAELESRGWVVDARIGCSGYRIDMAIRDPDNPGRYLLGIECDGAFYANAQTTRDRDRLRAQVLAGLGWKLHRVWSAEWRRNRAKAIQRIEDAIREAQSGKVEPAVIIPASPSRVMNGAVPEVTPEPAVERNSTVYQPFRGTAEGDSEQFYQSRSLLRIAETIRVVVAHEAPIVRELMVRRVAAAWGIGRVTTRVEARIAEVLAMSGRVVQVDTDEITLWTVDQSPSAYDTYRPHGEEEDARRDAAHIPTREIANAAASVLRSHIAMSEEDLIRHTAQALGFARPTERIAIEMKRGIHELAKRRGCEIANGQVKLPR